MDLQTERLDDGDVVVITIDPEGEWERSRFPHPLVTVDYTAEGDVFQVVAVGSMAKRVNDAIKTALQEDLGASATDRKAAEDVEKALVVA